MTKAYLESLTTSDLTKIADNLGVDIPSDLDRDFIIEDIRKQVYRSHNIAVSAFFRLYPAPKSLGYGLYFDFGAQGDVVVSPFYLIDTHSEGKKKFYNDYAFNPFIASAIARIGSNSCAFFARYRFTDIYNSKVLPMELPPLTFGVQFILN